MSWVAVGVAGASLVGSMMSSGSGGAAAGAQAAASRESIAEQRRQYDQTRQDNEGYRQAGNQALGQLSDPNLTRSFGMSDFQADPGYQFRMDEANKALQRSAAAKGGLLTGGTLKGMAELNQNLASGEYQNAYSRYNQDLGTKRSNLYQLAGYGLSANGSNQAAGQNMANQNSSAMIGAGDAQAAGMIADGNQRNQMFSSMGQLGGAAYGALSKSPTTTGYGDYAGTASNIGKFGSIA